MKKAMFWILWLNLVTACIIKVPTKFDDVAAWIIAMGLYFIARNAEEKNK
jgi:hypothetical protein